MPLRREAGTGGCTGLRGQFRYLCCERALTSPDRGSAHASQDGAAGVGGRALPDLEPISARHPCRPAAATAAVLRPLWGCMLPAARCRRWRRISAVSSQDAAPPPAYGQLRGRGLTPGQPAHRRMPRVRGRSRAPGRGRTARLAAPAIHGLGAWPSGRSRSARHCEPRREHHGWRREQAGSAHGAEARTDGAAAIAGLSLTRGTEQTAWRTAAASA